MAILNDKVCMDYLNKYKSNQEKITNYAFALCDPTWKELYKKALFPSIVSNSMGGTIPGGLVTTGVILSEMKNSMFVVSMSNIGVRFVMINYLSKDVGSFLIPYEDIKSFEVKKGWFRIIIKIQLIKSDKSLVVKFNKIILSLKKQKQNVLEMIEILNQNCNK
jgi:hypothetical protein